VVTANHTVSPLSNWTCHWTCHWLPFSWCYTTDQGGLAPHTWDPTYYGNPGPWWSQLADKLFCPLDNSNLFWAAPRKNKVWPTYNSNILSHRLIDRLQCIYRACSFMVYNSWQHNIGPIRIPVCILHDLEKCPLEVWRSSSTTCCILLTYWMSSPLQKHTDLCYYQGRFTLFCCNASAVQHRSFSQPGVAHHTGSVSGLNMTGSLQCCSCWIACMAAQSASIRHQCSSSHDLTNFSVWSRHVTAEGALLIARAWEVRVQALCTRIQVPGRPTWLTVYREWRTSSHVDACSGQRWSSQCHTGWPFISICGRQTMKCPNGLGHDSAYRPTIPCCVKDTYLFSRTFWHSHTSHFDFVVCSWCAVRLHHVNLVSNAIAYTGWVKKYL